PDFSSHIPAKSGHIAQPSGKNRRLSQSSKAFFGLEAGLSNWHQEQHTLYPRQTDSHGPPLYLGLTLLLDYAIDTVEEDSIDHIRSNSDLPDNVNTGTFDTADINQSAPLSYLVASRMADARKTTRRLMPGRKCHLSFRISFLPTELCPLAIRRPWFQFENERQRHRLSKTVMGNADEEAQCDNPTSVSDIVRSSLDGDPMIKPYQAKEAFFTCGKAYLCCLLEAHLPLKPEVRPVV
ncbi:unnamed protein product, partial [Protopolystoma xenopodis]